MGNASDNERTAPMYCTCETPLIDVEHDAGCRRCGRPVDFTPAAPRELRELERAAAELGIELTPPPAPDDARSVAVRELRELRAELELLESYDRKRQFAGYDYGAGQRAGELARRRHDVERLEGRWDVSPVRALDRGEGQAPTRDELRAAYVRVLLPRLRRATSETYRRHTPATERTIRTLLTMGHALQAVPRLHEQAAADARSRGAVA